jgi:hypothetical protein
MDPRDEIGTTIISAGKMPPYHFVSDGKKPLMLTGGTLDPWLLTNPPHPLIPTRGRISRHFPKFGFRTGADKCRRDHGKAIGRAQPSHPAATDGGRR